MDKARDDRRRRELQRLQLATARQQAEIAQRADSSTEQVGPVVGMPADVVLTLTGYRKKDAICKPQRQGWNRLGLIMKWFYSDMTLRIERIQAGGAYVVTEVEEVPSEPKNNAS